MRHFQSQYAQYDEQIKQLIEDYKGKVYDAIKETTHRVLMDPSSSKQKRSEAFNLIGYLYLKVGSADLAVSEFRNALLMSDDSRAKDNLERTIAFCLNPDLPSPGSSQGFFKNANNKPLSEDDIMDRLAEMYPDKSFNSFLKK